MDALKFEGKGRILPIQVGDVMLFRTTRPVAKGEELLDRHPAALESSGHVEVYTSLGELNIVGRFQLVHRPAAICAFLFGC